MSRNEQTLTVLEIENTSNIRSYSPYSVLRALSLSLFLP